MDITRPTASSGQEEGRMFDGVRFFLAGFDPSSEIQYSRELENNGGFNVGHYDASCTHVIVHRLTYDDPICLTTRKDKKILVTDWWVADSLEMGMVVDPTRILYKPVKDFNGIPGSQSLCMCLTGYQSHDRYNIMRMVDIMGAQFTKPLIAKEVTHLICYKFEGDKYGLAKQMGLKLVNHRWLEDCLKAWELLPEDDIYQKSGWELELLEAQAGDSEDEGVGKFGSPMSRQGVKSGSLFSKSRGTSSPTPMHVTSSRKLHTPKSLSKVCSDTDFEMEKHMNAEHLYVQYKGTPSSTKCDLGALLTIKGEVNKDSDEKPKSVDHKKVDCVGVDIPNQEDRIRINLSVEGKERECMDMGEQDIPTKAARVSSVSYSSKTHKQSGTTELKTRKIEALVNAAQGKHLVSEMGMSKTQSVPSSVANRICNELVQRCSGDVHESVRPRHEEITEANIRSLVCNATEVKQRLDTDQSRKVDTDDQFKSLSESIKRQTLPDKQSRDSNSVFKKVRTTNVVADLSNILSNLEEASDSGKVMKHSEETSPETLVNYDIDIQVAKNDASCSGIGNLVGNADINGQKTLDDVNRNGIPFSAIVTPNADCQYEPYVGGKRQRQLKTFLPSKRKETVSDGRSTKINKALPSPVQVCDDKVHVMESRVEDGMTETKTNKEFKISAQLHASGDLVSRTPKSVSLQSVATNGNSVVTQKRGREKRLNKKAAANKTTKTVIGNCARKDIAELIDLEVPNGVTTACKTQAELQENEYVFSPDFTSAKKSDASEDNQQQLVGEGSSAGMGIISKQEIVSLDTFKHQVITSSENPRKRGRPSKKVKPSELLNKFNPGIKDVEDQDKNKTVAVPAKEFDNCLASTYICGTSISKVGSSNALGKSDSRLISRGVNLKALASVEQPFCSTMLSNSPYKLDDHQRHGNGSIHQNSSNLSLECHRTVEIDQNFQVSGDCGRMKKDNFKDFDHVELETPQNAFYDALQRTQSNNLRKNEANKKSGISKQKKSESGANIDSTSEKIVLSVVEKSFEPLHDKNEEASTKTRKVGNTKKSTKTAKRSWQDYENSAPSEVKGVTQVIHQESSEVLHHSEPRWFILSGHRLQRREFQQLIKGLGGKLLKDSHQWCYQATHLVVPEPLRRTEKFFAAVAAGRWVLTTDYLTASKQAGRFLDEQGYEWHKSGLNEDGTISFEAPRKWRLFREIAGHGALHGFRIIVYGECIAPSLDTLKRVVKAGGGLIVATSPPYNRFLAAGVDIAIISPGIPRDDIWIQEFLQHNIACVLVDFLVEYVCKPSYPFDKHVLFNTHAAVEKFLKRLVMNRQSTLSSNISSHTLLESKLKLKEEKEESSTEIFCSVCGAGDRDDVMLLCGDEKGRGCGIAMHIDCCQPPLEEVPEEDWFCFKCQPNESSKSEKT